MADYKKPTIPATSEQQRLQMELYIKLGELSDTSWSQLKKMVQNKKGYESEQISKEELLIAKKYFDYIEKNPNYTSLPKEWHSECKLEDFKLWFNAGKVNDLLKLVNMQQETGSSLIPIKGISKIMQAKLRNLAIFDVAGLLAKGRTQEKRNEIARTLDVDVRLVNSWVKQADLWRVEGMTTDTAYFLVQIGVRNAEDLSNLDIDKAYPVMERLAWVQPDFYLIDKDESFANLIEKAGEFSGHSCVDQARFSELIAAKIKEYKGEPLTQEDIERLLEKSKGKPSIAIDVETWETAPYHLFRKDVFDPVEYRSSGKIITDGLEFLENLPRVLPLPSSIYGEVHIKWNDEDENNPKFKTRKYYDALVEISGIATSSADKAEKEKTPKAYTSSEGKFNIMLPEKLNMQEGIIFTVSQGAWKQTFLKSASDIINSVPEQKIIDMFASLQATKYFIETKEWELEERNKLKVDLKLVEEALKNENLSPKQIADLTLDKLELERKIARIDDNCKDIAKEIKKQQTEYDSIKKEIFKQYSALSGITTTTTDLEKIYQNLLTREVKAEIGILMLIEEIFKGYRTDLKKTLPSVKLMGNDDEAIHLSSDTAPSRVFSYGILQRLVEPTIGPKVKVRQKLESPVDVMDFKKKMYTDPDNYPQMVSLGIGYALNMHQAWAPDGFALGSLLYSLVLAPGEEQRLVIRENAQSYTVSDDAEGVDSDRQTYELSQVDDTTAAYNYALNQLSKGSSSYDYKAHTDGFGGGYGGAATYGQNSMNFASSHGIAGAYSNSKGSGSSSSSQSNAHNEASSAAQTFQHNIKSAADRISQSKRISMRTATSEESNSVATKIIANHNHSHTMTIQYWEVMRRFRLETCIDGVDLVLFIPLKIIRFIPDGVFTPNLTNFDRDKFIKRYDVLLKYADDLLYALPFKYRTGLNSIKKYAAYPDWKMESLNIGTRAIVITFNCDLLSFDDLTASLTLKNRKGTIAGSVDYIRSGLSPSYITTQALKQAIKDIRNGKINKRQSVTCTFMVPAGITNDDLSHITLYYSCEGLEYTLYQNEENLTDAQKKAYDKMQDKISDLAKDNKGSAGDRRDIAHYMSQLPEAFRIPNVILSSKEVMSLGSPTISNLTLKADGDLSIMLSNSSLTSSVIITLSNSTPVLRYAELQQMEATMHHIASEALRYSQVIWASLSEDELAIMLEQYTIDMDFDGLRDVDDDEEPDTSSKNNNSIDIPLLNCVNVKKLLGFYGNCILLPFTYPKRLAKKLGKSASEIQDALYRYHTCYFRVPNTTISLPTDGMIGEAVLGETNVSEVIDLTRFWNWKDSPIDKMEITPEYLNNTDYLADKTTKDIVALNLPGATAPIPVTVPDLITALVSKQTPQFQNITGLDQLKEVLNAGTASASEGRKQVLDTSVELAKLATSLLTKKMETDKKDTSKDNAVDEAKVLTVIKKAIEAKDNAEVDKLKNECEQTKATQAQAKKIADQYCKDYAVSDKGKENIKRLLPFFKNDTPGTGLGDTNKPDPEPEPKPNPEPEPKPNPEPEPKTE